MKAVVSTTYDNKYLFFLPVICWCWNKLGVDVICFMPEINKKEYDKDGLDTRKKLSLIMSLVRNKTISFNNLYFTAPEHKEATYAQCSRLYAACLDLPAGEVLVTSDADMIVFDAISPKNAITGEHNYPFTVIYGHDLVPEKQFPICYISSSVREWRKFMQINGRSYQGCLDDLLGHIEAEHFRGNYWGKDQETAYNCIINSGINYSLSSRARPGTQFATKRYDRDDAFLLERLSPDTIDYHLPRPGYEENNFNQIMTVLTFHYPNEDFRWLINYRDAYVKLL